MRYLVEASAVGALRRGAEIEQFLGPKDLYQLPQFLLPYEGDEDMPFCELGIASEPLEALELTESLTGAVRTRWMNRGLGMDEYADYVHAGSPSAWPVS